MTERPSGFVIQRGGGYSRFVPTVPRQFGRGKSDGYAGYRCQTLRAASNSPVTSAGGWSNPQDPARARVSSARASGVRGGGEMGRTAAHAEPGGNSASETMEV